MQVPGQHKHTYEAVDMATSQAFPAPRDNNDNWVGQFPDIADYLVNTRGLDVRPLIYTQSIDACVEDEGSLVWIMTRKGQTIVVRDWPRLVGSPTISTP